MGKVFRQGEVLIGGGGYNSQAGLLQYSVVCLAGKTTNGSATNLTMQGDGTNFIELQPNSILGFEAYVSRLVTGGSSGVSGNFSYRHIKGVVRIDNSKATSITQYSNNVLGSTGSTGAAVMAYVSSSKALTIEVTGEADKNISWFASITLHENKTNATTF